MSDNEANDAQNIQIPSDVLWSQLTPVDAPTTSEIKEVKSRIERRKHARVSCQWTGMIQTTKKKNYKIRVVNVSMGGVAILAPVQLPKGAKLLLNCVGHLDDNRCSIQVICLVTLSVLKGQNYQLGLQFDSSIDAFRKFIIDYFNMKMVG